jgi:hypothetical protein
MKTFFSILSVRSFLSFSLIFSLHFYVVLEEKLETDHTHMCVCVCVLNKSVSIFMLRMFIALYDPRHSIIIFIRMA